MSDKNYIPTPMLVAGPLNSGHGVNSKANVEQERFLTVISPGHVNAYSRRDAVNSATVSAGSFLMREGDLHAAYDTLFAEYHKVRAMREHVEKTGQAANPHGVGKSLPGVVHAATQAKLAMQTHMANELRKVEAELSLILNGMLASRDGQASTDAANAGMIRGKGSRA